VRKIIFALAFGVLFLPDYGFTLGLGEIEITTALNQELNAEIELLSAAPEDVDTLIVKLASREEFSRAGIDRPYMLNSLKFNAEMKNGVPIIRVTSDKPIREPFLNFLVEIDWPKGHMMREYTLLLDPPVFMGQQPQAPLEQIRPAALDSSPPAGTSTLPGPQSDTGFRPTVIGTTSGRISSVPVPVPTTQSTQTVQAEAVPSYTQTSDQQSPGNYRIRQGDTLWSLADSMRPDQSVSIEQMMLAMLRSNPEAFINENVNGLKRGYILRIPDRDDIITLNQADAVALVREQHALWREYQQAVTPDEPTSAMDREGEVAADAGFDQGDDARLEIVAAGSGVSASGSIDPTQMSERELRAELAIARESLETERVEKEELLQRVGTLEGQVERMKSLLTLEDTDLAEMQQAATPAEADVTPADESIEDFFAEEQAEVIIEEAVTEVDAATEDITAAEDLVVEEFEQQQIFVDEEQLEVVEEVIEQPITSTEDFSVAPSTQPAFIQQDKGPLSALLNNPLLLAAAGGGLLIVLLLIALIMRRRKAGGEDAPVVASNLEGIGDQTEEDDAVATAEQEQVVSEVAAAEAVADTEADGVADVLDTKATDELPSADDTVVKPPEADEETEPRDDVIAEADVYLAYGIYQQAEELLQNAIKEKPDNESYRVKLAETYFASKNSAAFIDLATEMNQRRAGEETAAWKKIVAIGTQLTPEHALFNGETADMVGDLGMDGLASNELEPMDIDLGVDEESEALAPDLDLGFDEPDLAAEPLESVEFDLSETGAEAIAEAADEGLEFDLSETGAGTTFEAEEAGVEFDLDEAQTAEPGQADEEEFSLDIEAAELGIEEEAETAEQSAAADAGFDLDLSAEAEAALATTDELEDDGLSLDDIDAAEPGFDIAADAAKAEQSLDEAAAMLDLSDMGMDEDAVATFTEPEITEVGAETTSLFDSDDELDLSELDDIDEVGTKLDLAKAYLDMGDADGTRSILDEVMSEGDDTQKREAEELLSQIG